MKLNIIDCRNQHLDQKLLQLSHINPICSSIFPNITNESLPIDIKHALRAYIVNANRSSVSIEVIVEINKWIDKVEAIKLLQLMHTLIKQYLIENECIAAQCNLAIFENHEFISIQPEIRDKSIS